MRIGILTGGGDVPGLNPCIKAVVNRAEDEGISIIGIRKGWWGLLNLNPDDPDSVAKCTIKLDTNIVRTIDRSGGTFLHTSRTNPSNVKITDTPEFLRGPDWNAKARGIRDFTPACAEQFGEAGDRCVDRDRWR